MLGPRQKHERNCAGNFEFPQKIISKWDLVFVSTGVRSI